jgi:DNA-binding NarL/FixJ family response regulator
MSAVAPETPARVVIAVRHPRLRAALVRVLATSRAPYLIASCATREQAVDAARATGAQAIVIAAGLLEGDVVDDLRRLADATDVPLVVVGSEDGPAYAAAVETATSAEYVPLAHDGDALLGAVARALAARVAPRGESPRSAA